MPRLSHTAGEVISYIEMCQAWSTSLQRGMNFRLRPDRSVILMSRRENALYRDRIEENGNALIYEGHDISRSPAGPNPKLVDQPRVTPSGRLTQNGMFAEAAAKAKNGSSRAELAAVYEKIHAGIWASTVAFASPIHGPNLMASAVCSNSDLSSLWMQKKHKSSHPRNCCTTA